MAEESAAASHSHSKCGPSKDCHEGEIVCSGVILEADAERDGEPALLCEGRHKRWAHASCVGISEVLYEDIRSCDTPWLCQNCLKEAAKAVQQFPLLKDEVQLVRAENTSLKEELTEVRALLTSMHLALTNLEARVSSVANTVDLLQATPSPAVSQTERCGSIGGGVRNYASACSGNGGVAGRTQRQQGPEDKLSNRNNGTGQQSRGHLLSLLSLLSLPASTWRQ